MTFPRAAHATPVPDDVVDFLLTRTAVYIAHTDEDWLSKTEDLPRRFDFGGDDIGRAASWLWKASEKDRLWRFLADVLAEYRNHNRFFDQFETRLTLDELLGHKFRSFLTVGLSSSEIDELVIEAKANVPSYYGDGANRP